MRNIQQSNLFGGTRFRKNRIARKHYFMTCFFIANMNITENIQNDEPTTFPSILTKIIVNSVTQSQFSYIIAKYAKKYHTYIKILNYEKNFLERQTKKPPRGNTIGVQMLKKSKKNI